MSEQQMRHAVMNYNVFARASPQNKIQIVEALQAEKQVCRYVSWLNSCLPFHSLGVLTCCYVSNAV
jgi:hypothetical protein